MRFPSRPRQGTNGTSPPPFRNQQRGAAQPSTGTEISGKRWLTRRRYRIRCTTSGRASVTR